MTTIHAALSAAQKAMKPVHKGGTNTYDKYKYATLEDFVEASVPALLDAGLALISSVEEVIPMDPRITKNGGTEYCVRVKMKFTLLGPGGEMIEAYCFGEGQDRADKALYKAITGCRKYGLASILNLATTDDPERDETVGRSGEGRHAGTGKRAPASVKNPPRQMADEPDGGPQYEPDLPPKKQAAEESHPKVVADIAGLISRAVDLEKCDMVAAYIDSKHKAGYLTDRDAEHLGDLLTKKQVLINTPGEDDGQPDY